MIMDIKGIARWLAEGSIVLLKNEGELLPLEQKKAVAFFGRTQMDTILSGNGSGAASVEHPQCILDECEKQGVVPVTALAEFYRERHREFIAGKPQLPGFEQMKELVHSGLMYEIFGKYTPPAEEYAVPNTLIDSAARETDMAILVIGRASGGEECDRHLHDDYYLTDSEQALVQQVCQAFPKVALVLNLNGLIDLSWAQHYPSICSILFLGIPGEEGPAALAEILTGAVNPSGKLAFSIAQAYADYPACENFSWDKDHPETIKTYEDYGLSSAENGSAGFAKSPVTVYQEDIYLGYRYFDSFGVKPLYPFGFGLSYTRFAFSGPQISKADGGMTVSITVENTGSHPGKEVAQLYVSVVGTESKRAYQELKGFVKTKELAPGESQKVTVFVPWRELACYSEQRAAWVIERGSYALRLGTSSAQTELIGQIVANEDIIIEKTGNRLEIQACNRGKIDFLIAPNAPVEATQLPTLELSPADMILPEKPRKEENRDFSGFTTEQLAALCVGYGPGVPWSAFLDSDDPDTIFDNEGKFLTTNNHPVGFNGYVSPAIEDKGIQSIFYKDGPAGVGETAWPSEMLLCCSFDTGLCAAFGDAVGAECEAKQVDVWLAPAVNLQRHPLGGRNFEYPSEDPYLAGACACAIAGGVQKNHPVLVCAKHFAVNEQETYRRGSEKLRFDAVDSILTERAARELYLKPFEMLVRNGGLRVMMSSFNKINGTFAGGSKDLCSHILREEWGFDGVVVTDWGDMDMVVDGADAVAAGNDVIMPGGPPVIRQILKGYENGRVTRRELELAVKHLLRVLQRFERIN
jgi:beta-glucosidase